MDIQRDHQGGIWFVSYWKGIARYFDGKMQGFLYGDFSDEEPERPEPSQIEVLYASTYDMFEEGEYLNVIQSRNEAYETYKENPLMPNFDFLEALSYGHLDSLEILKSKLGTIIARYPNHEMEKKAREYLAIINKEEEKTGTEEIVIVETEEDTTEFVSIYSNDESKSIFGMIAVSDNSLDALRKDLL